MSQPQAVLDSQLSSISSKSNSVAEKSGEDIGRAIQLGIEKGLKEQGLTTEEIAQLNLEEIGKKIIPISEPQTVNNSITPLWIVVTAWLVVGIPMAWGVYRALLSVSKFIH
jgi:hypothetical protein